MSSTAYFRATVRKLSEPGFRLGDIFPCLKVLGILGEIFWEFLPSLFIISCLLFKGFKVVLKDAFELLHKIVQVLLTDSETKWHYTTFRH